MDLWLTNPDREVVRWSKKNARDGAFLDIDMNADQEWEKCETRKPVENVRYKDDGKKLKAGIYTITVHYYKKQQAEGKTPYTLAVKLGHDVTQVKGDPTSFGPEERDNYYVKVEPSGKACFGLSKKTFMNKSHKC